MTAKPKAPPFGAVQVSGTLQIQEKINKMSLQELKIKYDEKTRELHSTREDITYHLQYLCYSSTGTGLTC
eukprot:1222196-Amphidinium_carterae.1